MRTPRHSFFSDDGRVLRALFWVTLVAFFAGLIWVWLGARRAAPVMLDLETGRPVAKKPVL